MSEAGAAPKLLLPKPRGFVNRAEELGRLQDAVAEVLEAGEQGVFVFTGLPGVGKTTLVAQAAHLIKDRFADGCLCATLGASAEAATVEEVLAIFLMRLGIEKLPPTRQGLWSAYQEVTAERALLVVLDDVESAAQVKNLLPASSRTVVLATSRRRSDGFAQQRFEVCEVAPFTADSAVEMVLGHLGTRAGVDGDAVRALAEACGYLPLALSIAGAQLSVRRGSVENYVRRLRAAGSVVGELTIDGQPVVEAIFEVSYQDLDETVQRAYRLLSLHPGARFTAAAAAALLDVAEPAALLDELVIANLLGELDEERYEFHSLVREHAAGLAAQVEHPADCRDAVARVVEWYLTFTVGRDRVLSDRAQFGEYFDGRVPVAYQGPQAWERAVGDLERERPNLRRAVRLAADEGLDALAWQLAEASFTFFFQRDLSGDLIAVHTAGLQAARRIRVSTGDARPELRMLAQLGAAFFSAGDNEQALTWFEEAAAVAGTARDEDGSALVTRASMFEWQAFVHQRRGAADAAVESMERARALAADPGFPAEQRARVVALHDMNGAPMLSAVGRHAEARAAGRRAIAFFTGGKERPNLAKALANLGFALLDAGDEYRDEALSTLREAIALTAELGMPSWEADAGERLGKTLVAMGRIDQARPLLDRAAELLETVDQRRAEALRQLLDGDFG